MKYKVVIAAGGLVKDKYGNILFIFRNGRWDLPKGKAEKDEKPRQTAIREVMEETGLSEVSIIKNLQSTYHTYTEKNTNILKKTYWYEMICYKDANLKPQKEEGITEVKWIKTMEIEHVLNNTYGSIFNLISKYH